MKRQARVSEGVRGQVRQSEIDLLKDGEWLQTTPGP
jgi:hypothetical protein